MGLAVQSPISRSRENDFFACLHREDHRASRTTKSLLLEGSKKSCRNGENRNLRSGAEAGLAAVPGKGRDATTVLRAEPTAAVDEGKTRLPHEEAKGHPCARAGSSDRVAEIFGGKDQESRIIRPLMPQGRVRGESCGDRSAGALPEGVYPAENAAHAPRTPTGRASRARSEERPARWR